MSRQAPWSSWPRRPRDDRLPNSRAAHAAFYGSIARVAAPCATGARAVAPVAAAGVYVAFGGYKPLLWLLVVGSVLAALTAHHANRRLAAGN
jgi:hypothetical protein